MVETKGGVGVGPGTPNTELSDGGSETREMNVDKGLWRWDQDDIEIIRYDQCETQACVAAHV